MGDLLDSQADHLDLFSGLGGIRPGGCSSSRLVNGEVVLDGLEGKNAISAFPSSTSSQNPVGRRVSKRTAARSLAKSSGKLQASNLLSIIEGEQALKGIQSSGLGGSMSRAGVGEHGIGGLRDKSEEGGLMLDNEGMLGLGGHPVSDLVAGGVSSGVGGSGGRLHASHMISPSEMSRIENLHFSVETVPHLVKDYVPAFSGKFAFLPQPPLDGSGAGGYDYSESCSAGGAGGGSQSHHYGGEQGNPEGGSVSHGLRSRKPKNSSSGHTKEDVSAAQRGLHLPKLLPSILTSICGGEGLKMVAKEKLSFWMDLPCNMDRKKAKTGLGPSTRESLRKELKKQGELFRLVSTKDEFLCDSKMIKGADVSKLYLDLQRSQPLLAIKEAIGPEEVSSISTGSIDIKAQVDASVAVATNASTTASSSPALIPHTFPPTSIIGHPVGIGAVNSTGFLPQSTQQYFVSKMEEDIKGKLNQHFSVSNSISSSTIETNSPTRKLNLTQSSLEHSDHSGGRTENNNCSNNSATDISEHNLHKSSSNLFQLKEEAINTSTIIPHGTIP
ncbi:hypothetical protein OJ252_440 [Cryptosporidium canis]|uniref:Uncharacterized protein n=1 Tax=Cryptosporidium canis TaxID=195482 RepID=A0ABQ8PB35_9CRYT|nr:hypothetical protein OJ252_440 [Cryptosporidium canis]